MFLLLCLALLAGTLAQVPTTCPGPKAFEGRFQRYDRERRAQVRGRIAYDETERRIREFEEASFNSTTLAFDILRIYDQNLEYRVDLKTRKCNVTQPTRPFRPYGVPPDAKYVGEGVIGAAGLPGESVTVASFEGSYEGSFIEVAVTYPDCFPVNFIFADKQDIDVTNFYDLMSGISDPEVFIPPKECTVPV